MIWWLSVLKCPCTLGAAPLLGGFLEADSKSLAGRAKGTSLTQDRDGTGLGRGQKEMMEEQRVRLGWQVTHLYGEELGEVCCAFLAARPTLDTRT